MTFALALRDVFMVVFVFESFIKGIVIAYYELFVRDNDESGNKLTICNESESATPSKSHFVVL